MRSEVPPVMHTLTCLCQLGRRQRAGHVVHQAREQLLAMHGVVDQERRVRRIEARPDIEPRVEIVRAPPVAPTALSGLAAHRAWCAEIGDQAASR